MCPANIEDVLLLLRSASQAKNVTTGGDGDCGRGPGDGRRP